MQMKNTYSRTWL